VTTTKLLYVGYWLDDASEKLRFPNGSKLPARAEHFYPNKPDFYKDMDCASIKRNDEQSTLLLSNSVCSKAVHFLCKKITDLLFYWAYYSHHLWGVGKNEGLQIRVGWEKNWDEIFWLIKAWRYHLFAPKFNKGMLYLIKNAHLNLAQKRLLPVGQFETIRQRCAMVYD